MTQKFHCISIRFYLIFNCQVGKDSVHTALSLVGYEDDVKAAMGYVFGSSFVCDTLENAKKVGPLN